MLTRLDGVVRGAILIGLIGWRYIEWQRRGVRTEAEQELVDAVVDRALPLHRDPAAVDVVPVFGLFAIGFGDRCKIGRTQAYFIHSSDRWRIPCSRPPAAS
jgi:hypothetical protein